MPIINVKLRSPGGNGILPRWTDFEVDLVDIPVPPGPVQPGPPTPVPPSGHDAFDVTRAVFTGGAAVERWPIGTLITRLDLMPNGFHVEFTKRDGPQRWPDVVPPGWQGGIQYTLWIGANLFPWHLAACINVDHDNGSHLYADDAVERAKYPRDLWYLDPALAAHTPNLGEEVAFMVTAGALRGLSVQSVTERSQVVVVPFPPASGRSYAF